MAKAFIAGCIFVVIVGLIGAYLFVTRGWMPANADGKPFFLESWAAHKSLHATLQKEAPTTPNPEALTNDNLIAGVRLYAQNCAVCHGASDMKESNIALGLFQKPPQLAGDGVEDDPEGVTYWKIKHGIRLTGMPAYSPTLTEEQIWQITLFLKHMDSLPAPVDKIWKSVPSQKNLP